MNKSLGILLGVIILLSGSLFYLKIAGNFSKKSNNKVDSNTSTLPNRNDCEYGVFDYNYEVYVVKPGDNMTSVVRNKLADINRLGEVILLNKSKYPTLLTRPEYLEKGWELKLPPRNIVITKERQLVTFKGHIHENSTDHFRVSADPKSTNTYIYDAKNSLYFLEGVQTTKQNIPNGACFEADIENTDKLVNSIRVIRAKSLK